MVGSVGAWDRACSLVDLGEEEAEKNQRIRCESGLATVSSKTVIVIRITGILSNNAY